MSITAGIVLLEAFNTGVTVVGNTSAGPNPGTSIVAAAGALVLGWLMVSDRGRALLDRWRARDPRRHPKAAGPSWAERRLDRANAAVAFAVGAAINLPGPFYVLALGEIANGPYDDLASLGLMLLFNAIMFTLLEVPLVGYLVRPAWTAEQVGRLSIWLNANGLRIMGALIGLVGVSLVVQGIAAAAG